jgi:hypothetical protein
MALLQILPPQGSIMSPERKTVVRNAFDAFLNMIYEEPPMRAAA